MPGINFSQPLFQAGGGAATDWGSVGGNALVDVPLSAQLKRGISIELGIEGLAQVDARLQKYLAAQITGQVQAQAKLLGQVQVPMNLFSEVGLAIRLQAIAEIAAAVQASIGLNIGDFIQLVEEELDFRGFQTRLFRIFMEEIDIGVGVYAKAAFTAQAYANLIISGSFIKDTARNINPGFTVLGGFGAGLKGGAGYRVFGTLGLRNTSRFVARTVDLLVDNSYDQVAERVPPEELLTHLLIDGARTPTKIAFRIAYEAGDYIAGNNVPQDTQGAQKLALRCIQVILEESQRYLLSKMIEAGLRTIESYLKDRIRSVSDGKWDQLFAQRRKLADKLYRMPADPFDTTRPQVLDYWHDLASECVNTAVAFSDVGQIDDDMKKGLALMWSAAQLFFVATKRLVRLEASISVIGLPPGTARTSFEGALSFQPVSLIGDTIRAELAAAGTAVPASGLTLDHLLLFVAHAGMVDYLRQACPEVDEYLDIFQGTMAASQQDIARLLLVSAGSILPDANGNFDDQATLQALVQGLKAFSAEKIESQLAPIIRSHMPNDTEILLAFDEVLVPSLRLMNNVCFDELVNWHTGRTSKEVLLEALSGVLMKTMGRTVVLTGDLLLFTVQREMRSVLLEVAAHVNDAGGPAEVIARNPAVKVDREEVVELLKLVLEIGADVLKPPPDAKRQQIRALLYQIIDPVPSQAPENLLSQLRDDLFVPNADVVISAAGELTKLAVQSFLEFVERLLSGLGELLLREFEELLEDMRKQVEDWINEIQQALEELRQQIVQLISEISRLIQEATALLAQAVDELLVGLAALGSPSSRQAMATTLADRWVAAATPLLFDNPVYKMLPADVKSDARRGLRNTIAGAINLPVLDPIFQAIAAVAEDSAGLIEDIRAIDPNADMSTEIADLILDRIESHLLQLLGGNPGFDVGFSVSWSYPEATYHEPSANYPLGRVTTTWKTATQYVSLGHVSLPFSEFFGLVRNLLSQLTHFRNALVDMSANLYQSFLKEMQANALERTKDVLSAERDRHDALVRDNLARPRGIEISEPVAAGMYEFSVPIDVFLEHVPRSFLGLEADEVPHVLMALNGVPLDLRDMRISESAPAGVAYERETNVPLRGGYLEPHREHPDDRGDKAARVRNKSATASFVNRRGGSAKRREDFLLPAVKPGKRPPLTRPREKTSSGVFLQTELPLSLVEEGFNTLLVAVVDGARRVEQVVSFIVQEPASINVNVPGKTIPFPGHLDPERFKPKRIKGKAWVAPAKMRKERLGMARERFRKPRTQPLELVRASAARLRVTVAEMERESERARETALLARAKTQQDRRPTAEKSRHTKMAPTPK